MLGGYAMGLSAEMDFFCYLIIFSYGAMQRLCLFSLLYKPPIAPLSVLFFSLRNLLYFKSYNRLNVLVLAPVPVLSGISRNKIPFRPVPV